MRYYQLIGSACFRFWLILPLALVIGFVLARPDQTASATTLTSSLGKGALNTAAPLVVEVRRGGPHVHAHLNPHVARQINHGAYRPTRVWHSRHYWGDVVAGVALGTAIGVAAAGVIPARPAPYLCWYWNNPQHTSGHWDYC